MPSVPVTTAAPYRFCPLLDKIEKARDEVAQAERDLAEVMAELAVKPEDADLLALADEAEADRSKATAALEALESELQENPDQPVYLLRVPTFRSNAAFEEEMVSLPTYPGDRRMVKAIAASGLVPADDPDLVAVQDALKKSGAGLPEDMSGLLEDLYDRAADTPEVGAVRRARARFGNSIRLMRVRYHLLGFKGVIGADGAEAVYAAENGYPTDETLDAIPPADVTAIAVKIEELNSVRGKGGNSRGGAASSALPPPSQPSPSDTETLTTTETPAAV